jgi:hypothetical protein
VVVNGEDKVGGNNCRWQYLFDMAVLYDEGMYTVRTELLKKSKESTSRWQNKELQREGNKKTKKYSCCLAN